MSDLKPCPFCGGEPEFERIGTPRQSCIVVCDNCGVRHESCDEGEDSGASWNRRAQPAQAGQVPPGYGSVWDILEAAMQAGVPDDKVQRLAEVLMQPEVKKSHFGPSLIGLVLSDDPLFVFAKEVIHGAYKPEELADAAMRAIRHHSATQKSIVDAVLTKRVPMTEEEVRKLAQRINPSVMHYVIEGVQIAERHHGIVGEKGGAT